MAIAGALCAHCQTQITDPTTQVIHGDMTYCCANCAGAMEQQGSGSDPQAPSHENDLHCAHCGSSIAHEATMEAAGNVAYCCTNCARAARGELRQAS
jgi:DNA-directed RNA polymerase subunit RPC12/RpoP